VRDLSPEVLVERSSLRDVDHLRAAAQAEHGLPDRRERAHQCDLVFVADAIAVPLGLGDAVLLKEIPEGKFDLVYMVDVIHHIKDIETMFRNISRVLKHNGAAAIFSDSHEHIRNRLTTKYFPETLAAELKRYPDTDDIKEALSKNGFREISDGNIQLGEVPDYGDRLIEIASKKGYSMFGLIPEEAIKAGIERIKADMQKQQIIYHQRAPYILARK
jgi:SAM-dependent methyltransferase